METGKKRVYLFDNIKFFLIWSVVLGHSMEPYIDSSRLLKSMFIFIYTFHMPAFLFITGLFSGSTIRDEKKTKEKVVYFVLLYILLKLCYSVLRYYLNGTFTFKFFWEDGLPWFMLILAMDYAFGHLFKNITPALMLVFSIGFACIAGYDASFGDYFCIGRFITYFPFFLVGYYMDYTKLIEKSKSFTGKLLGIGSFGLLFYYSFFRLDSIYQFRPLMTGRNPFSALIKSMPNGEEVYVLGGLFRLFYYGAIGLLLVGLISYMVDRKLPVITETGKRTLQIYFFHNLFLWMLRTTKFYPFINSHLHGVTRACFHIGFSLLIVLVFSLPLWKIPLSWLEKECHEWFVSSNK